MNSENRNNGEDLGGTKILSDNLDYKKKIENIHKGEELHNGDDLHRRRQPRKNEDLQRRREFYEDEDLQRRRKPHKNENLHKHDGEFDRNDGLQGGEGLHRKHSGNGNIPHSHKRKVNDPDDNMKNNRKKGRSKPFSVFLTALLMIVIMLGFATVGGLVGAYVGIIRSIPELGVVNIKPGTYNSIIYDANGNELNKLQGGDNREYVTLDQIPKNMQQAIIAIEDERFYEHNGVDMQGFARGMYSTLTGGQVQGGSTLTQQLIKNNVTKVTRNTPKTKIKEQYLALMYEKKLKESYGSKEAAKNYILELYLNTIALGHGYSGIKTAAEGYFGKQPSELTLAECACLAGITNNPSVYSPRTQPEENRRRQTIILNYMLTQGRITQEEYDQAINEDVYANIRATDSVKAENNGGSVVLTYYEDALVEQLATDLQTKFNWSSEEAYNVIYNGGLQIYSNMDKSIQKIVDDEYLDDSNFPNVYYCIDVDYRVSVENKTTGEQKHSQYNQFARSQSGAEGWVADKKAEIQAGLSADEEIIAETVNYNKQPQSAMVIIDYHTGQVKAIAGGRGEKKVNRAFNRATNAARQPGSVFKVLAAYAPAVDLGKLSNASTIVDEYYQTPDGYAPKNWWGASYRGAVNPRTGIKNSMNIVAVKIMVETGIDLCYNYLLNFGFTTLENDNHASTALGGITNGVTQLEVAAAYGTIANQGQYIKPCFYEKVLDHDGNVLLENTHETKQVLKSSTGYILTEMMEDTIKSGTGTAARLGKMPVAGKTGTTTDSKDLTFVGYTPYYVCSIWLGYDRYDDKVRNMENINQSRHLVIWRDVMSKIHQNLEVKEFEMPDTVEKARVCKISGLRARPGCPAVEDYFDKESIQATCSSHQGFKGTYFYGDGSGNYTNNQHTQRTNTQRTTQAQEENDSSQGEEENNNSEANTPQEGENPPAESNPEVTPPPAEEQSPQEAPAE